MVILQSLFALVSRSAGKILNAIFGWAVRALFGETSGKDNTFLSGLVAAAAVWPLLLVGLLFPKMAALLLGFIPVPDWVPDWTVRLVWAGLVVLVPCAVGLAVAAKAPPHLARQSFARRLLAGLPITVGVAITFVLMFVMVPIVRGWAMLRGLKTADVPLVTETVAYHETASLCFDTLNAHGFEIHRATPGWWARMPVAVLRFFSGKAFAAYVPDEVEHFEAAGLAITFYPTGALLRGKGAKLTWAQGLIAEATARSPGLQTSAVAAQRLETQLKRLWRIYLDEPEAHANSAVLVGRMTEVTRQLASAEIDFDDWQVLYRQLLQLRRALHGEPQLYEEQLGPASVPTTQTQSVHQEVTMESDKQQKHALRIPPPPDPSKRPVPPPPARMAGAERGTLEAESVQNLSTVQLIKEITAEVTHLAGKQIDLAKAELAADLKAQVGVVAGLSVGAIAAICTLNLLLVTAVFALATKMPGWAAGLLLSGVTLAVATIISLVAWNKRVRKPLERTQRTLKEDVQWTKERLA